MKYDHSIIIPFLNESENIDALVQALNVEFGNSQNKIEVIFVDDGSTDESVELLSKQSFLGYDCKTIVLSQNYGSHAALRAGIQNSEGTFTSFLYADLQDPIDLQKKMFDFAIESSSNIVWATRRETDNPLLERLFSRLYASLMKKYVSKDFPPMGFDVVMFDEKVKNQLNLNQESNSSIFLQILLLGFKQGRLEYTKQSRKKGKSKWTFSKKLKLFIDSFVAFSYFPIRLVTINGIVFFVIGILWTAYVLIRKLLLDDLEPGWPALVSILMIGFGVTNVGLGVVAEYIWRTLDASRKRPVFVIKDIIKNE